VTRPTIAEFAAKRRNDQDDLEKDLFPDVHLAIEAYPANDWYNDLLLEVARLYLSVFHNEGGTGQPNPSAADFTAEVKTTLDKTENPTPATVDRISVWLATAILNAGTQAAAATDEEFLLMEWVTMHDSDVRPAHREVEGQQRPPGEPFTVGGSPMRYPGDPTAPIELWINCRCTLAPILASDASFRKNEGATMSTNEPEQQQPGPLAWHGVLAPEGVWSGDGRRFAPDSLRFRDLPLPLTWQKATEMGHDGSVVIGKIDSIERADGMMNATGTFLATPEADEVIGLIAEFGRFGVSVDADDAEFEFDESGGSDDGKVTFTSARIASASVVSIPAFAEAFVALGPWAAEAPADGVAEADPCDMESDAYDEAKCAEKEAGSGPPQYAKTTVGMLPYATIGYGTTTNSTSVNFGRGPGWITNPVATKRIHDYWTKKGQEGYAKIGWGTAGDFNRCRVQVGEEIGENSPEDLIYLNQICAQWHHDALGIWPGEHLGLARDGDPAPALSLVASGATKAPAGWFADPNLPGPTHLTVTEDRRVFGHIATWDTCHIGYSDVCVAPPQSSTDYQFFATGRVLLDDGSTARTGVISLGGGHASDRASIRSAIAHYDSTSTGVADVCVGEDDHGIWCAGWIRPGVTEEQVYALRASDVSGDWREFRNGQLEMVAALAVNVGGFPTKVGVENGAQVSLVAAGVVTKQSGDEVERLAELIEKRLNDREDRRVRMRTLRERMNERQTDGV
jgi:hypothetical protein